MSIKSILIFAVGAGVGATVTYFVQKHKYEIAIEEASAEVNGYLPNHKNAESMSEDELKEYYISCLKDLCFGIYERERYEDDDEYYREDVNPVEEDEGDDSDISPVEANPHPYEIGVAEFGRQDESWNSETLSWYKDDLTMTDDEDEPLDNWKSHVGFENIDQVLADCDGDAIYVRNEVEMCDYEILIFRDSYKHAVLGEEDDLGDFAD